MRVLTIGRLPHAEVGGLPLYTANLAAALVDLGVEQHVVHTGPEPERGRYRFPTRSPAPRTWPARGRLRSFREAFAVATEARRAIRELGPDVVHLQYGGAMDLALLSRIAGPVPVVVTAHCGRAWAHLGRFPKPSMAVLSRADRVLVISADQRELFVGARLRPERVVQIGSLVEPEFFAPVEPTLAGRALHREHGGRPRAVYLGRIAPEKGLDLAIDALAALPADQRPTFTATGPVAPDHAAELTARAAAAGLGDDFRLADPVATPAERRRVLDEADLVIHPTRSDVKPLVVIEAMARALPVVASALPGTVELMEGTGSSFAVGDAGDLTGALAGLLPRLGELTLGLDAREVAEAYHPERAAAETLAHYEQLAAAAAVAGGAR